MSMHKDDWLKALALAAGAAATYFTGGAAAPAVAGALGEGATGLTSGGMFANAALGAADADSAAAAAQIAAQQAAQQGAGGLASSGMFSGPQTYQAMVKGLNVPPIQPGMETSFAKDAVNMAHQSGSLNGLDFVKQRGMVDLMNMNQPGEWASRFGRNLGNLAGGAGKMAGANMLMSALTPQSGAPSVMPSPHAPQPQSPQGQPDIQQLIAAARRGDPQAIAILRAANIDPTRI